jgi:hypothetical protein
VLTLAVFVASGAQAQARWSPEIGIQGGYIRIKPAGTGRADQIDLYDIPGANFLDLVPAYGSFFAIVPVSRRIALEPALRFSQTTPSLTLGTTATLGLRADYALTTKLYAATGGVLTYVEEFGVHEHQLGLQAAFGYRLKLSRRLNGRLEAQWSTMRRADQSPIGPHNTYALLLGVSTRVRSAPEMTAPQSERAARRAWRSVVGVQAGYSRFHIVGGGGDFSLFTFPGSGASGIGGILAPTNPSLFAVVPVGKVFGLELGLDAHQIQSNATTLFSAQINPRLNCAVRGGWYAAAGGSFHVLRASALKLSGVSGANIAWGYRFDMTGNLGGRVELGYTMYKEHLTLQQPAANALGITFGTTVALK